MDIRIVFFLSFVFLLLPAVFWMSLGCLHVLLISPHALTAVPTQIVAHCILWWVMIHSLWEKQKENKMLQSTWGRPQLTKKAMPKCRYWKLWLGEIIDMCFVASIELSILQKLLAVAFQGEKSFHQGSCTTWAVELWTTEQTPQQLNNTIIFPLRSATDTLYLPSCNSPFQSTDKGMRVDIWNC